ncbi:MAG: hypothetical protein AABM64_17665 [Pseudomonadota bacterium]
MAHQLHEPDPVGFGGEVLGSEEFSHTNCGHRAGRLRMSLGNLFHGASFVSQCLRTQAALLEVLPPESPRICL